MIVFRCAFLLMPTLFATVLSGSALAQSTTAEPLTAEQKSEFNLAVKDYTASQWAPALTRLLALHRQVPGNTAVTKFAAQASLNLDDPASALSLLQPLETASPEDWQVTVLLARTYAQSHQGAQRDAELAKLIAVRQGSNDAAIRQLTQIYIEHIPLATGHVELFYSLQPWSQYRIYRMARVFNSAGLQTERVTLESSDFEQAEWARDHPKEAAAGQRRYSLDGYTEQFSPTGEHTQTHSTFAFLSGNPTYDEVRQRMLDIIAGKTKPISSMGGIRVQ